MKLEAAKFHSISDVDGQIDALGGVDEIDSEGWTPLCFAVFNGSSEEIISHIINNKGANPSKVCDRGKSPLQYACLALNDKAASVIIQNTPRGNISKKDVLQAALLTKEDILKSILDKFKAMGIDGYDCYPVDNSLDNENNNAFHLACMAQCYASIDLLIMVDSYIWNSLQRKNNEGLTPIEVAENNSDIGIQRKLSNAIDTKVNSFIYKDEDKEINRELVTYRLLNHYRVNDVLDANSIRTISIAVMNGFVDPSRLVGWPWV